MKETFRGPLLPRLRRHKPADHPSPELLRCFPLRCLAGLATTSPTTPLPTHRPFRLPRERAVSPSRRLRSSPIACPSFSRPHPKPRPIPNQHWRRLNRPAGTTLIILLRRSARHHCPYRRSLCRLPLRTTLLWTKCRPHSFSPRLLRRPAGRPRLMLNSASSVTLAIGTPVGTLAVSSRSR